MSIRNPFGRSGGGRKSAISRTDEREFERNTKKLDQLEENTKRVAKDMKLCTDYQAAQSNAEVRIAQQLLNGPLCRDDGEMRYTVEQWYKATQKLHLLMQELNACENKAVTESMKKFSTIFPSVREAAKKRDQSLQEYSKCKDKLDKYTDRLDKERTGPNIVKKDQAKKAHDEAKQDFDTQNTNLMQDMPKLYDMRLDYFEPSFQALIKSQVKYYTDSQKVYSDLAKQMNKQVETLSNEEYELRMQNKLAEIRALSITVDD